MLTRRQFIKAGVIGGLALSAAGAYVALGRRQGGETFDGAARRIVGAVVPAILAGVLPAEPGARRPVVAQTVEGVGVAIAGLSAAAQKELAELFALLDIGAVRAVLAGVTPVWEQAAPEEVAAFLNGWRESRLALLRSAYAALHDLVLGAWYGVPEAWQAIGYPGPPEML